MAGNSKRKLRNRRAGKRGENKRQRAAARQVLEGGYSKMIPSRSWAHRPQQPVIIDAQRPQLKGAKSHRDHSCPGRTGNKRHHYLIGHRNCSSWRILEFDLAIGLLTKEPREIIEHYKLCAYCSKERVIKRERVKDASEF